MNSDGLTPLHLAAIKRYAKIAKALLSAGANPNALSPSGWTPYHFALSIGHGEVVKEMIDAGADSSEASLPPSLLEGHSQR